MPRRRVKGNDLEALGDWLLEYWQQNLSRPAGQPRLDANLTKLKELIEPEPDDSDPVFCYDDEHTIHIVIPHCPWSLEELQEMRKKCSSTHYKYELGFVIRGGCR